MNKPHVHRDLIIAWANGAEIQYKPDSMSAWHDWEESYCPAFGENTEYRIKPEREYPVTRFSKDELFNIFVNDGGSTCEALERVANAAIKQHILDTEQK